jgi:isoquinoline 1-oxidoreductase alpha subunit
MSYKVQVNGTEHTVEVEGDTPLLWVLRDTLNMTGTKFGCGVAQCGACTVHVDGMPTRSCQLPVQRAGSMNITTIEGIGATRIGKMVQQAWLTLDVPQCGYCQAGQIMAAAALLEKNPKPTEADIDNAMSGNLCRCATYIRIRAAIKHVATQLLEGVAS